LNINSVNKYKILTIAIGLTQVFCFTTVNADTNNLKNDEQPSIEALEPFDATRDTISHQVVSFADWIDTFFAGDRVYDELQESHVKIYMLQTHFEHDKPLYQTKIKAKLNFPKTEQRLKLLIESGEDDDEESLPQEESIVDATEKTDQAIGLRFIETKTPTWRIHTDALLRFRPEVETITRLRLRRRDVWESWVYRFSETVSWYSIEGLRETSRMNIDHSISENWLFRSSTFGTWKNSNGYFNYGQDFLLFQSINKRKALTYRAGIRAITEHKPRTTDYILSANYREQIHKGWLFYEVIPAIHFPIEEDHKPVKSVSLKLEIVFDEN
jgi:hypothetical protein